MGALSISSYNFKGPKANENEEPKNEESKNEQTTDENKHGIKEETIQNNDISATAPTILTSKKTIQMKRRTPKTKKRIKKIQMGR